MSYKRRGGVNYQNIYPFWVIIPGYSLIQVYGFHMSIQTFFIQPHPTDTCEHILGTVNFISGIANQSFKHGGLLGLNPPPWINKIYSFQGGFKSQRVQSPLKRNRKSLTLDKLLYKPLLPTFFQVTSLPPHLCATMRKIAVFCF